MAGTFALPRRLPASVSLVGVGWWRAVIVGAAAISALLFLLFWDRAPQQLDAKGGIAVFINIVIVVAALVL